MSRCRTNPTKKLARLLEPRDGTRFWPGSAASIVEEMHTLADTLAARADAALSNGDTETAAASLYQLMLQLPREAEWALAKELEIPGQLRTYAAAIYLFAVETKLWRGDREAIARAKGVVTMRTTKPAAKSPRTAQSAVTTKEKLASRETQLREIAALCEEVIVLCDDATEAQRLKAANVYLAAMRRLGYSRLIERAEAQAALERSHRTRKKWRLA